MPVRCTGAPALQKEIRRFKSALRKELATEHQTMGREAFDVLKARVSRPFQEVPSYIYETEVKKLHGGPGKYPRGTVGTFARFGAPEVRGTEWEGQVQVYSDAYRAHHHYLRDLLTTAYTANLQKVEFEIGYPEGTAVGRRSPTGYIASVLFGTKKMQPRNYFNVLLRDFAPVYGARIAAAVIRAMETVK